MRFFRSKFFIGSTVLLLLISGLAVYAQWTGGISPVRRGAAALLAPAQKGFTAVGNFVETLILSVENYQILQEENSALRATLADTMATAREAELILEENDALRELLKMRRRFTSYTLHTGEVIAVQTGLYGVTYTLDCGSDDGVAVGNGVIVWEGMVGVITAVGPNWSEMIPITDPGFGAGIMISRNGETGVAAGNALLYAQGQLRLSYLPQDTEVRQYDRVITSGLGGLFPPNILIGRVDELWQEADGLSHSATVIPAASLQGLRQVFIITDFTVSGG